MIIMLDDLARTPGLCQECQCHSVSVAGVPRSAQIIESQGSAAIMVTNNFKHRACLSLV